MISPKLLTLAKQNHQPSINAIIKDCEPLIISVVKKFDNINFNYDEAIQEGRLAVLNAINLFDESKKVKFTTYARTAIKNKLLNYVKKLHTNKNEILVDYLAQNSEQATLPSSPEDHLINYEKLAEKLESFKKDLSKLETQILSLKLEGYSYVEIATQLKKTNKSVDNALTRIKTKILKQEKK